MPSLSGSVPEAKEIGRSLTIGPHDAVLRRHRAWMSTSAAKEAYGLRKQLVEPVFGIIKEQQRSPEIPAARPRQRGGRVDRTGHRFQPAHPVAGLALPLLQPATPRAESPSHFLIPTGRAITLRQSIATFNSPGKGCSINPTGLIQLLLPPTLYITFGTGSVQYTLAHHRVR